MKFRKFKDTGIDISLLGFGCMRFPLTETGRIERRQSTEMIDLAYKSGVNYFDTAFVYHEGESEEFVGEALSKYERKSFYLATKLPYWCVKSVSDAEKIFKLQLERLKTDYIDFYLIHSLNLNNWRRLVDLGVIEYAEKLKESGKIKYLGFSFHDDYPSFEEIIRYRDWDFCQIQMNYMDTEYQAGISGYRLACELNIPVIIMEPVKGGSLAHLPEELKHELDGLRKDNPPSAASWALRWTASIGDVLTVLSGMSTIGQVEENLDTFNKFTPLNEIEMRTIEIIAAKLRGRVFNRCTKCNYCKPCPEGVDIVRCFRIWNDYGIYNNKTGALWSWNNELTDEQKPHNCTECGKCEGRCPQHIEIRKDLKALDNLFKKMM